MSKRTVDDRSKTLTSSDEDKNWTALDWAKFNLEMRILYKHPECEFCQEKAACFCKQCIAPTYDEIGHFYCHTCHADNLGVTLHRNCPTCHRPWPKEKA